MADQFDLGELNEAELMDSSDLQDVDFDASGPAPSGDTTFDIGDFAAPSVTSTPPPAQDFAGFDAPAVSTPPVEASPVADFGGFDAPAAAPSPVSDFGGFEAPAAASPVADFGSPVEAVSASPVGDFGSPVVASPVASSFDDFGSPAAPVGEGPMEEYEKEHRKILEQKEQESNERKQREIEEAKKDIAEYFEERKKRTEKNREKHGASTNSQQSTPFDEANPWQNISSLVDLDGLPNKDYKDVSRMREILKQVA